MSRVEKAITELRTIFNGYAKADGLLNKAEFKAMIEKEMPAIQADVDNEGVNNVIKDLDLNRDSVVNFYEFMRIVADLTKAHQSCKM